MTIPQDSIFEHWRTLVVLWIAMNFIYTLPSPTKDGFRSTWVYVWVFSALHGIVGGIPRIIATLAPGSLASKFLNGGNGKNLGGAS